MTRLPKVFVRIGKEEVARAYSIREDSGLVVHVNGEQLRLHFGKVRGKDRPRMRVLLIGDSTMTIRRMKEGEPR